MRSHTVIDKLPIPQFRVEVSHSKACGIDFIELFSMGSVCSLLPVCNRQASTWIALIEKGVLSRRVQRNSSAVFAVALLCTSITSHFEIISLAVNCLRITPGRIKGIDLHKVSGINHLISFGLSCCIGSFEFSFRRDMPYLKVQQSVLSF